MAETTADVRRDIELTRERMSNTIAELERKLNVMEVVREHPWPSIALAAGAGFLISRSGVDVKAAAGAAASTVAATRGAGGRLAPVLDDFMARVLGGLNEVLEQRADMVVGELKRVLGAPATGGVAAAGAAAAASRNAMHRAVPQSEPPVTGDRWQTVAGGVPAAGVPAAAAASGSAFQGESRDQPNSQVDRGTIQRAD